MTTSIGAPTVAPPSVRSAIDAAASRRGFADAVLAGAVRLWFVTVVVAQWSFLYYIIAFYGVTIVQGNFEAWSKNTMLPKGYVAGDTVGNLVFASHAVLAAVIAVGGTLQLVPHIRRRFIAVHRWNGRVFLVTALLASTGGLYMTWVRNRQGTFGSMSITIDALLIFIFVALAWRAARAREISRHRRWALRAFIVVNGVWFQRVGFAAWVMVNQGPVAMSTFHRYWQYLCYLLPLAVLELYLRAKDGDRPREKVMMASALALLTILMGVGAFGFYIGFLRPILGRM
jgi:hypothetical protein